MTNDQQRFSGLTLLKQGASRYPASPDEAKLEIFTNLYAQRDYEIVFETAEFTALCPVTGQPDFGVIHISYVPHKTCIESKSLKLYLFSFRNYNTFYEEAVNRICDDLVAACQPRRMTVTGTFTARGGITSTVRVHHPASTLYSPEQSP